MKHRAKRFIQSLVVAVMLGATTQQISPVALPSFLTPPIANPVPQLTNFVTQYGPRTLGNWLLLRTIAPNFSNYFYMNLAKHQAQAILNNHEKVLDLLKKMKAAQITQNVKLFKEQKEQFSNLIKKSNYANLKIILQSTLRPTLMQLATLFVTNMFASWFKQAPASLVEQLKNTLVNFILASGFEFTLASLWKEKLKRLEKSPLPALFSFDTYVQETVNLYKEDTPEAKQLAFYLLSIIIYNYYTTGSPIPLHPETSVAFLQTFLL